MTVAFELPPDMPDRESPQTQKPEPEATPRFALPPDMLGGTDIQPSPPSVASLVSPASPFARDGQRARALAEQATINGVDYSAADRDLDHMRMAVSHERTIPAVEGEAAAIDKYLPRTQRFMVSHGPALVAASWNDMQGVSGFERVMLESRLAHEMGRLGMEQQRLNLRRFWGVDGATDRAALLDVENKLAKYGELRKGESFFSGALRGMWQTFVPQAMAGGEKVITRGAQAGAAAGLVSAAFGPAAAPAAGTAFGVGATTGAVEYAFEQSLAEVYGGLVDMRDALGKPLDQGTARVLAVAGGAVNAGLEMVGLKYAVNLMPGLKGVFTGKAVQGALAAVESSPAIAKAVGESGVRLLKALGGEVSTEMGQEIVSIGAETVATALAHNEGRKIDHITPSDAVERVAESGEEAAKAFFFPSVAGASLGGLGAYRAARRKARQAQVEREGVASLAAAVQQSSLVSEAPTVAENVLRFATDGKPLYFAPQALANLFQTAQGQKLARGMGISAGQVADAIDMGVDVAVPIAKQTALMRSEFWQELEPHARLTPNGATEAQSVALAEGEAGATTEALGDFLTMLDEVDRQAQRKDNWRQWTAQYRFDMEEAGFTKLQADSFGDVLGAHAEVFAPLFGHSPQAYLEQRLARIERVTPKGFEENTNRFLADVDWNTQEEALAAAQAKVHITDKSPLMASLWGQADAANVKKAVGKDVYGELVKRYGRRMFAKKGSGVAWDVAVQDAVRQGLLPKTANPSDVADALAGSRVLYQPLNANVDLDAVAPLVIVEPRFTGQNPKVLRKRFPSEVRGTVLDAFSKGVVNEDTGMRIGMSARDFREHFKFAESENGSVHLEAIAALPELMRMAKLVESYGDKKPSRGSGIKQVHRFMSALRLAKDDYAIMLTVKEFEEGGATLGMGNPVKLYHHRVEKSLSSSDAGMTPSALATIVTGRDVEQSPPSSPARTSDSTIEQPAGCVKIGTEKEMSAGNSGSSLPSGTTTIQPSADIIGYTLRELLASVTDSEGNTYFARANATQARGNILFRPSDMAAMISIFKGKGDISTIVHEGAGHLFLENLREAAQLETAPEWVRETWGAIAKNIGTSEDAAQAIGVDAHEKFARMAVEYFRRGKAPSRELQSVFRMFGRWLASIYRGVRRMLDLEDVSPEVEKAMARLMATEEDIADAEATLAPEQAMPEQADASKWTEYLRLARLAQKDAEAAIALRRMEEEQRVHKEARLEAKILMTSDPGMLTIARMKEMGGISIEDITDTFGEETAWTVRDRWGGYGRHLVRRAGRLALEDVMQELGVTEPHEVLAWLLDAQTERQFMDAVVAERLAEWEASYSPQAEAVAGASADAALKARDEALSGEEQVGTQALLDSMNRRARDMALDSIEGEYQALAAAESRRASARNLAATLNVAEGRKRADMAARRERLEEAIGAERKRRAALGAAYRVRMERENIKGQIRRIAGYKTALDPFHQQILALVARYDGLGTKTMRPRREVLSLQDFYVQWALGNGMEESHAPSVPQWMMEHMGKQADMRLGDLTIEQLRELHGMIRQLHHMGRTAGALVGALHKADINAAVTALTATMERLPETAHIDEIARQTMLGKARTFLRNSYASKAIMRYVFKMADGFVSHGDSLEMGANERIVHRPLADAANEELRLRKKYSRRLRDALAPLAKMKNFTAPFRIEGVPLPEDVSKDWRGMWTMEKVFCLALNMGNEGNVKAILGGYGFSYEDVNMVLARMSPELWGSVRQVWDILESMYPRLNAVHEALYGVPLPKVEHAPFQAFSSGQVVDMPGGYYPLIFDRRFSEKAARNEDLDNALNAHEAITRKPNPKSGFTKERKGGKLPPLLSIDVLSRHITDSIHYAAFTLPLRDAYVLTSDARYKASFVRAFGEEMHSYLLPWLRAIARPEPKLRSQGDRIINWMASRGTLTTLGFSFRTAAMGFTSIPTSIHRVGFVPFIRAAAQCAAHPFKTWRMVTELSSYMDNRTAIMDRDMRAYLDSMFRTADFINMGPLKISRKQFEKAAFAMIVAVDAVVAAPTWLAQHERALGKGMDMEAAVRAADDAVFEAQAGGSVVDMSAMMRAPGMTRLFTVFMTFASNQYNKTAYYWRGLKAHLKAGEDASAIGFGEFSKYMALEIVGSSAIIALLFAAAQEGDTPEAKDVVWETIGTLLGGHPLLRMIPSTLRYGSKAGETGGMRGIQSVGDMIRSGVDMATERNTAARQEKFMRSSINAAGFLAGVPTIWMWRTVDGIEAFDKGIGGPLTPLFGPPPKKKKGVW